MRSRSVPVILALLGFLAFGVLAYRLREPAPRKPDETAAKDSKLVATDEDLPPDWKSVSSPELQRTPQSIALTLRVSRNAIKVVQALRREDIPFERERMRVGELRLDLRDADGRSLSVPMEAPGLLAEGLEDFVNENGELVTNDEVESLRVPSIVIIPDCRAPIAITVRDAAGRIMGEAIASRVVDRKSLLPK